MVFLRGRGVAGFRGDSMTAAGPSGVVSLSYWKSRRVGFRVVELPLIVVCSISFYKFTQQQGFRQARPQNQAGIKLSD
jgi:hypothetical protein